MLLLSKRSKATDARILKTKAKMFQVKICASRKSGQVRWQKTK